jgi:hypothetical protein
MAPSEDDILFDGSNWEDLLRLITLTHLDHMRNPSDYQNDDGNIVHSAKIAQLTKHFTGSALDWVGKEYASNPALFQGTFDGFVTTFRNAFGISDIQLDAFRRTQLDDLKWEKELPVFFAEFDRLTQALTITGDSTKITLLREKLPHKVKTLIAEQALDFHNYETMRERLLTMWALDPGDRVVGVAGASATQSPPKPKRRGKKKQKSAKN